MAEAQPEGAAQAEPWSVRRVVEWAATDFRRRGFDAPRLDAELLLCQVLGIDRVQLLLQGERPLTEEELGAYRAAIKRRRSAEPVAYILGRREFFGLTFRVDARVLIPRPDTETLVEVALERTGTRHLDGRALDLCTGSGCVAIAFHKHRPTWQVTGVDVSEEAIAVARDNAQRLGAVWGVRFLAGDLDASVPPDERFDLITANPPYIPTGDIAGLQADIRDHEPRIALEGGSDGLDVVRRVVARAAERLVTGGILALEVGQGQAPEVVHLLETTRFRDVEVRKDYGGIERVVSGRL